jgi:hypothetical protein
VGADDGYVFSFGIQFGAQYYPEALQFTPSVGNGCDSSYWVNPSVFSSVGENCDWAVFNPTAPGNYTFEYQVVNDFGCVFTDEISIEVTPGPQVSVNDIDSYCNTPQELVAVIQNAAPGAPYAYNWSPSTGLSSPVIASPDVIGLSETTTYTVTVTQIGTDNCVGTAQATVTVLEGGCADSFACNFDPNATCDNGTCFYYDFTAQMITGNPNITPFSNYLYAVSQIAGHSYFWSVTNGVIVSGQGTNAIQVLWGANGPYDVTLTEGDGICESTTSLFSVTSVNELYEGLIQVWPNPTRDVLQIEVAPEWLGSSWRITNLLGQEVARPVLSQSLTSIETSNWAEGVYLLQNEAAGVKMKIVKN